MADFPVALRTQLQTLRNDGYYVIGQPTVRNVDVSSLTKPDYIFIRITEDGMVDISSLKYWDAKHSTYLEFSDGQKAHITDHLVNGGTAQVKITNIPTTIKGIDDVDEEILGIPMEILDINIDEVLSIISANKIGSIIDANVAKFGKE